MDEWRDGLGSRERMQQFKREDRVNESEYVRSSTNHHTRRAANPRVGIDKYN